ncbi:MAG: hypothetical protein NWT02_00050 [Opitutales bacterium]|jgi:hypothetical protein|nr:hypothetical protein [Opitutales bacterium]MDP4645183.1 hypothetical protein [Opitutales bacterium]MDP4694293.1 hypothetical protein [Opitutales bacterium]MDP4778470.1 hypothetical protein [Opitutales bacterium]MDP4884506.1 hypothetical protein [Opitutales bacterium]
MYPSTSTRQRNTLLIILWGLLFTKCFVLEFLVHYYAVPINSMLYVWSLSIFMATIATIVYVRLRIEEDGLKNNFPPHLAIWVASLIGMLLMVAGSFTFPNFSIMQIPSFLAVLLGLSYCTQGLMTKRLTDIFSAFGWWLGASMLFRQVDLFGLLTFAFCIILFTVLPALLNLVKLRKAQA